MRYKIIAILLAAIVAAAGCSKNDTRDPFLPDGYTPTADPIAFQIPYNWGDDKTQAAPSSTRGIKTEQFVQGDSFGIYAYYLATGTWDESIIAPNFMNNQKVTKQPTNAWGYTPLKYWSTIGATSFFAYYPYSEATEIEASLTENNPVITFTPNTNVSEQCDFMTAAAVGATEGGVTFDFEHQLTRIQFAATQTCVSGSEIDIHTIELNANSQASGTFNNADGTFSWNEYTADEEPTNYTITKTNNQLKQIVLSPDANPAKPTYIDLAEEAGVMYIPSNLVGDEITVNVDFTYKGQFDQNVSALSETFKFKNSNGLKPGTTARCIFSIFVDKQNLVYISPVMIEVRDWETENFEGTI